MNKQTTREDNFPCATKSETFGHWNFFECPFQKVGLVRPEQSLHECIHKNCSDVGRISKHTFLEIEAKVYFFHPY